MDKYTDIISLGYVCNVTELLSKLKRRQAAYPFDRIATPMWAVYELIENRFDDFLNHNNITSKPLFENDKIPFVYDSKYYTRIAANTRAMNPAGLTHLLERTHARETRLLMRLEQNDPILFIRTEEPSSYPRLGSRLELPEYAQQYQQSEHDYLRLLSKLLTKRYPGLQFKILYMSSNGYFCDDPHHIIGIPAAPHAYNDSFIGKKMVAHFAEHKTFLDENL